MFCKKKKRKKGRFLKISQYSQGLCQSLIFKVFSCEFCQIFKNAFFTEYFRATASDKNPVRAEKHDRIFVMQFISLLVFIGIFLIILYTFFHCDNKLLR